MARIKEIKRVRGKRIPPPIRPDVFLKPTSPLLNVKPKAVKEFGALGPKVLKVPKPKKIKR